MIATTHGCAFERGAWETDSIWYHANAARLIANALKRIGRRNAGEPGRYSNAGSAVWLMMNISAKPNFTCAGTRASTNATLRTSVADMRGFVHVDEGAREDIRIEPPQRRSAARLTETRAQRGGAGQPLDRARQCAGVAGLVRERVDLRLDQFRRATGHADDHRAPDRESFRDDQAERLGLRAGVHDDVERAERGGRAIDEAGQADASSEARARDLRREFLARVLAAARVIERAANDVAAARRRRVHQAHRLDEGGVAFPAPECREEPYPHGIRRRGRESGQPIEIGGRSFRRELSRIDGVVDGRHRHGWTEHRADVLGHAL